MLCTPPAFILSQDQTLEIIVLKHPEGWSNLLSSLALSFFYFCLSSILICKNFRDPFQALYSFVLLSCCSIFKDHSPPLLRQLDYYTTFFPACQYLLQKFFQLFQSFFQSGLWWLSFWGRAFIFYHKEDKLSIAFCQNAKMRRWNAIYKGFSEWFGRRFV